MTEDSRRKAAPPEVGGASSAVRCEPPPRLRAVPSDSEGPRSIPAGAPTVLAESRDATAAGSENAGQASMRWSGTGDR